MVLLSKSGKSLYDNIAWISEWVCVLRYLVVALTFHAWSRVRLIKIRTSGWRVTLHLVWGFWSRRSFTRRLSRHCTEPRAKWAAAMSLRRSISLTHRSRSRRKSTSLFCCRILSLFIQLAQSFFGDCPLIDLGLQKQNISICGSPL